MRVNKVINILAETFKLKDMTKGSREFDEMQKDFEKWVESKNNPIYFGVKIERAPKESSHFYENGDLNKTFKIFMSGYSLGRLNYMN